MNTRQTREYEREMKRIVRENERSLRLQQELDAQRLFVEEVFNIQETNEQWISFHKLNGTLTTLKHINDTIARCEYERLHEDVEATFYKEPKPSVQSAKEQSVIETRHRFDVESAQQNYNDARRRLLNHKFEEIEPTTESVCEILTAEAKENIKAFFPWKRKRLQNEYVDANLASRYHELHNDWQNKKDIYKKKRDKLTEVVREYRNALDKILKEKDEFISTRTKELYDAELNQWNSKRDEFYCSLLQKFHNVIDGNKEYVINAISDIFPDKALPCIYFVDAMYDEASGKVFVDLDLPEIEDIPQQKVILTTSGKTSIRQKSQTDLRSDYAHCVFGLAINVAYAIFNVSLKINEVEISGYTQRPNEKADDIEHQYVFVINFDRDTFSKINFNILSSVQVLDFFQHYKEMSKNYMLNEIDLDAAYDKM